MELFALLGFLLAGYAVIANDSLQTLGTWISSNQSVKWYYKWGFASLIMAGVIFYGHYTGDVSYGRLDKIPFQEVQWYHALAPLSLLILTRLGIPVSTSFLVLSVFASSFVMESMLMKSFVGYGVAAISAYAIWFLIQKLMSNFDKKYFKKYDNERWTKFWTVAQWGATGWLWITWLQHDHANIAVFLPREHSLLGTSLIVLFYVVVLGFMFYEGGGKIQKLLSSKTNTKFVRNATLIDLVYALILYYFKEVTDLPMSTTFVFVGLLAGRELALHRGFSKKVFPLIGKDFAKLMVGIIVSVTIVFMINLFFK